MSTFVYKRKVMKVGDSLGITIPENVCLSCDIKKGDNIYLIVGGIDGYLLVDLCHREIKDILNEMKEPTSL